MNVTNNREKVDVLSLVRSDMRTPKPYEPAPARSGCKLDCNESPWNLPENVRAKLVHWLESGENLNRYPDSDNTILRQAAARLWGVEPSNVTCGVGSDQLIDMTCRVFLEPGDCIVTQSPTFGMYAVSATLAHGRVIAVPAEGPGGVKDMARAAERERAKVVFVCSPNNPTGYAVPQSDIRFVLDNTKSVVVVDEAYGEFTGESMIGSIGEYPNMIVLRTCSKAFGLAGLRVGYAVADRRMIEIRDMVRPPFNISTMSQLAASWGLEAASEFSARAAALNELRDELYGCLSKIPWLETRRSDANFFYVGSERDIAAILEAGGVVVRRLPMDGNSYRIRLSVGTREENKKVGDILCGAQPS
ncbi:MAG: histidinol-phosphate transaminase [Synergistaceae bacterium]|jgi:histidinol-phosphate aminotransferase|nr:histidinol-phosphate transaminase [Synergistaceae bacterium]